LNSADLTCIFGLSSSWNIDVKSRLRSLYPQRNSSDHLLARQFGRSRWRVECCGQV